MLYRLPAGMPHHLLCLPRADGRSVVEWLPDRIGSFDPIFFTPERAQFLLRCTSEFEIASSRLALGVCPFFVTGAARAGE